MKDERNLKKTAQAVGTVFGVFLGDNFTTPIERTLKDYPEAFAQNARLI